MKRNLQAVTRCDRDRPVSVGTEHSEHDTRDGVREGEALRGTLTDPGAIRIVGIPVGELCIHVHAVDGVLPDQ